jgi:hypothetical protein
MGAVNRVSKVSKINGVVRDSPSKKSSILDDVRKSDPPDPKLKLLKPKQLPSPWLLDSEQLLIELDRVREMILRVPLHPDTYGPTNAAISYVWDLQERLRYILHLHIQGQHAFRKRTTETPDRVPAAAQEEDPNIIKLPPDPRQRHAIASHAGQRAAIARRRR